MALYDFEPVMLQMVLFIALFLWFCSPAYGQNITKNRLHAGQ